MMVFQLYKDVLRPATANLVYGSESGTSRLSLIPKNAELPEKQGKHLPHKS